MITLKMVSIQFIDYSSCRLGPQKTTTTTEISFTSNSKFSYHFHPQLSTLSTSTTTDVLTSQIPLSSTLMHLNNSPNQSQFPYPINSKPIGKNSINIQPTVSPRNKPSLNYITLNSPVISNQSSHFPFNEGPTSLPLSHIPPMKEYKHIGASNIKNSLSQNTQISASINEISQNTSAINLQLATSPSRKLR